MSKNNKFVLLSSCLLSPYCRFNVLGNNLLQSENICYFLIANNISLVQLPCPELIIRNYNNTRGKKPETYKTHCEKIFKDYYMLIKELLYYDYELCGFLGIEGCSTCSIHWGNKTNKNQLDTVVSFEKLRDSKNTMGVFTETIYNTLKTDNIDLSLLEVPIINNSKSIKSKNFWNKLKTLQ